MKSDFRTSPRGWRSLLWAPATILIITTVLLNIEHSSAAINAPIFVDNNWIKLDKNFPPTYDSATNHRYSRFYYARGKISTWMYLTNRTMFSGQGITMLNLQFDIWRNNLEGKCAKHLHFTNSQFSSKDHKANVDQVPNDNEWVHFSEQYTEEQFRDFALWLYAQEGCEHSLMAIKNLAVTYNSYYQLTDKVVLPTETYKELPKTGLELADKKNQYLLENCDTTACTMKIKLDKEDNIKVYFWSSKEGDKLTVTGLKEESIAIGPTKEQVHIDLIKETHLKTGKTDLVISVKTTDNSTISFVQIGEDAAKNAYTPDETGNHGSWVPVDSSPFSSFLNKHKGAQVMLHQSKSAFAKIGEEENVDTLKTACYDVSYVAEKVAGKKTFTISVDSHAGDLIQRYPLATFSAVFDKEEKLHFCINDYIYDLTKVFSTTAAKAQLYLTSEILVNPLLPKKVAIIATKSAGKPSETLNFIRESMKANEKWSSIVSGEHTEIKADNNQIAIKGLQSQAQSVQIFSKWLVNDQTNPYLNARPVVIEVTTIDKTIEELKLLHGQYKLEATICDEIMECISVRQVEKLDSIDKHKATYKLEFDAHPNKDSHHLKLRLNVDLPESVGVNINLKSFGDPCFSEFDICESMIIATCDPAKADPTNTKANSQEPCVCDNQSKLPFCAEDQCAKIAAVTPHPCGGPDKCRNTPDDSDYECQCEVNDKNLQVWNKAKNCHPLTDNIVYNDQDKTWIMDVSQVNPLDYDICYKFTTPTTQTKNSIVFLFSLVYEYKNSDKKTTTTAHLLRNEKFTVPSGSGDEVVKFCFSQLMENYGTTEGKLTATVNLQSTEPVTFAEANSHLYSEPKPAPVSATLLDHLEMPLSIPNNLLTLNTVQNGKQQITFLKDVHQGQTTTLFSKWIAIPTNQQMKREENNLNTIKVSSGGLDHNVLICPPRNSAQPNCVQYNDKLGDALLQLNSDKFQIVYTLTALSELKAADLNKIPLTSEVSLWNACKLKNIQCPANTNCQPDNLEFACKTCPLGTHGTYCEMKDNCDKVNNDECLKQHSSCVQFTDGTYHCKCPLGYDSDKNHQKCLRKSVRSNRMDCSPDKPDSQCFLTNITSEVFSRLPKHFPRIDANDPMLNKENLYYAFRKSSQLTVAVEDKDRLWMNSDEDVCIKFGYYVSKESTLSVHFTEPAHPTANLELVSLKSPLSYVETVEDDTTSTIDDGALTVTEVCLKALLPISKLTTLEKFNLTFVANVPNSADAVIIELKPYETSISQSLIGGSKRLAGDAKLPTEGLRFLSRTTADLGEPDDKTPFNVFKYQWPVLLPEDPQKDSRWAISNTGSIEYKSGTKLTEETVIIESAWVNRLLRRANTNPPVYLSFNLELPEALINITNFNLQIVLVDANSRNQIGQVETKMDANEFIEKPTANAGRKEKTFYIPINQFEVPFNQLFKVQFRIRFRNMPSQTSDPSFKISDISFGDPCIRKSKSTPHIKADKMNCQGLVKNIHTNDDTTKCLRDPQTSGTVDFHCDCSDKSLTGKRCEHANFCTLKTEFQVTNRPNKEIETGDRYCAKNNKDIKCRNGKIGKYEFTCLCNNEKEKFNFETQNCELIDECSFKPCDFTSEICEMKKVANKPDVRECNCKTIYGFLRANANETCHQPNWEETVCDPAEICNSETGSKMQCLLGIGNAHRCVCPKGYVRKSVNGKDTCTPDMCSFKGAHFCEQNCEPKSEEPYYKCTCEPDYDAVENTQTKVTECKLKATSACKDWSGRYKVCNNGKKDCIKGFKLSADSTACLLDTFKMEPACPGGAVHFDDLAKEYVCDCKNTTITRGYFDQDTADMPGTCTLKQSICDVGQLGRTFCNARGAGCIVDPHNLNDFSCSCHLGRLFPDGAREKEVKDLRPKPEVVCVDVCDLPYRKSVCASIGAQCNSRKLWQEFKTNGNINTAAKENFCECVSGTFSQKDNSGNVYCVQEPKVLNLELTLQWSGDLQSKLDSQVNNLYPDYKQKVLDTTPTALQLVDPVSFTRAEFRALLKNREEEAFTVADWTEQIRGSLLQAAAAELLYNFNLADNPFLSEDDKTPYNTADQINQNVQLVSQAETKVESVLAYTVHLAVKPNALVKAENEELSEEEEDQLEADEATTAVAGTTPAGTTTSTLAPVQRDITLPKGVIHFNELMDSCRTMATEVCIIPYLDQPRILKKSATLQPVLHQPCTTDQACQGMSNCIPLNGSTFECLCGEGFDVEMRYTFKSSVDVVVHKNEYCKAQDLCASNCLDNDKTHTKCQHIAPYRASVTSPWVNDFSCDCIDKYVPQGAQNKTCTYVCQQHNCGGGDRGECAPAAKSATCHCKDGFYGEHCEHTVSSNTWWIVGIVVLGVLALAAIGAAVFFWRKS